MTPLLQLHQQASRPCEYHRVIWCPYWPEEGEEGEGFLQDSSKVLAYTLGEKVGTCWGGGGDMLGLCFIGGRGGGIRVDGCVFQLGGADVFRLVGASC